MISLFSSKKDLYQFGHGTKTWYFTSAQREVVHGGITYKPFVVGRGNIDDEDIDKAETEVRFPYPMQLLNDDLDDLQQLFINKIYFESVSVTILELYKDETLAIFKGRVVQPKFDDSTHEMTLICSTAETYQNRNILTRKFQKSCANKIYDRFCGLNFDDWAIELTVTNISGLTIRFNVNPTPVLDVNGVPVDPPQTEVLTYANGYFNRGLLLLNGVYTMVTTSTSNTLTLYRSHFGLAVNDVIKVAPACDQSRQVCHDKFNNHLRFMGFPNVPNSNPVNDQIIK